MSQDDLQQKVQDLEKAQEVQAAAQAGTQATQAATQAGQATTMAASQAGMAAAAVAGGIGLIVGMFLALAVVSVKS